MKTDDTLYILDSYGLIFRCFYAFEHHPIYNKNGDDIGALFGFFRSLHYILEHYTPSCFVAALDCKCKTFRHDMYPSYKANRCKTPPELCAQFPLITDILEAFNIPTLQCEGYEADDVIATVSKRCDEIKRPCRVLSIDKDLLQLVNSNTIVLRPEGFNYWKITTEERVQKEWGVLPKEILDYLSLVGDSADNVPGVKGIGPKTALSLVSSYHDIDNIYSHIDEIKPCVKKKLMDGKEDAYFSRDLIKLCSDVPLTNLDELLTLKDTSYDYIRGCEKLKEYGADSVSELYSISFRAKNS